jgi:hypothetical protein
MYLTRIRRHIYTAKERGDTLKFERAYKKEFQRWEVWGSQHRRYGKFVSPNV